MSFLNVHFGNGNDMTPAKRARTDDDDDLPDWLKQKIQSESPPSPPKRAVSEDSYDRKPEWSDGSHLEVGDRVKYNKEEYRVVDVGSESATLEHTGDSARRVVLDRERFGTLLILGRADPDKYKSDDDYYDESLPQGAMVFDPKGNVE